MSIRDSLPHFTGEIFVELAPEMEWSGILVFKQKFYFAFCFALNRIEMENVQKLKGV